MSKLAMDHTSKVLALIEAYPTRKSILSAQHSRKLANMICEAIMEDFGMNRFAGKVAFRSSVTGRYVTVQFEPLAIGFDIDFQAETKAGRVYDQVGKIQKTFDMSKGKTESLIASVATTLKKMAQNKVKRGLKEAEVLISLNTAISKK